MSPSRRPLRIALLAVAAVLVLAVGIGAVLLARFDPNEYKPDIAQAARRATGRDLALNGKISLKPSLWPTIQVTDVAFSNPPGSSRPQMATLQGLELQLGLLPLLSSRIEIVRVGAADDVAVEVTRSTLAARLMPVWEPVEAVPRSAPRPAVKS